MIRLVTNNVKHLNTKELNFNSIAPGEHTYFQIIAHNNLLMPANTQIKRRHKPEGNVDVQPCAVRGPIPPLATQNMIQLLFM